MKTKHAEWIDFSDIVFAHILDYCIPQYGDYPDKMIEGWTVENVKTQIEKYVKRIGTNVRGIEEAKRDTLKIAHYACLLLKKIKEEEDGMRKL